MPPDWSGRCAVIAAGGPSFDARAARLIGMARAADAIRVIAVNDAVYPCWYADIAYSCERAWWEHHKCLPGFPGRRMMLDWPKSWSPVEGVEAVPCSGQDGFDPTPGVIRHGKNSAYQAAHVAAHLGVDRIVFVGLDLNDGSHWFGDHPGKLRKRPDTGLMIRCFETLAPELEARGIQVINASPSSAVTAFPVMDLDSALYFSGVSHA